MSSEVEQRFEVAGGTVAGSLHSDLGKANQDAYAFAARGQNLVAVVCDGCGSSDSSEVGARLGARILTAQLLHQLGQGRRIDEPETWEELRQKLLTSLRQLVSVMSGRTSDTVISFFLFTVVGLAISGDTAVTFHAGDGLIVVNGDATRLGPFDNNEPPYLGYGLLDQFPGGDDAPLLSIHRILPSSELRSVVIATDGANDLIERSNDALPTNNGKVGPICQFWQEDHYFRNADAIRRRLAVINRSVTRAIWDEQRLERQRGLLEDDTTLVVVRRRNQSKGIGDRE